MEKRILFLCQKCGYQSPKWFGRCPDCGAWNSFIEDNPVKFDANGNINKDIKPTSLKSITATGETWLRTGISEFDRVLGGGIVNASIILIGGEPGIGKSTLLLQISKRIADEGKYKILYIAGEESPQQIKLRAIRLNVLSDNIEILPEICIENILSFLSKNKYDIVILDSIQTVFSSKLSSVPGTVSQIKECTQRIIQFAKKNGITFFIVGHVTKEGVIAGPRLLEHMVDTVIYFEGERKFNFRILRTVKNRFGSTNEIGLFRMGSNGLVEVINPAEIFLTDQKDLRPGIVLSSSIEGTRPLLIEIEALTTYTHFGNPRRLSQGIELNRLFMIIAIMEKYLSIKLNDFDIYINISGGVKISDPAIDLAVAISIYSSLKNKSPNYIFAIGEVSLSSDIKPVSFLKERINEAYKLGYKRIIYPQSKDRIKKTTGVIPVKNLKEAIEICF